MMNYYMIKILNELVSDERINSLSGVAKDNNRKVYIEGNEYQEYSLDLVFLVDTDDLFKKTIAFTITTNSFSSKIEVIKHCTTISEIFSRKQIKDVTNYIIDKILEFKNNNQNNQYLNLLNA
ncbi:hypothetical protein KPL47_13420 [Clostridium estertheticum]|uniref:hypothetical protein n=1 Tax=Clostridium estertheticum TaxID=238834 RepID=UPI001C0CD277|nr:hypothetical protein [Clostridium estertheticum]MBU3177332.1 hypothetical protein [Clostridium estertheticum]